MLPREFEFFRRIIVDLPEDAGSIGKGQSPVNDN
jgi:hypothetical protein